MNPLTEKTSPYVINMQSEPWTNNTKKQGSIQVYCLQIFTKKHKLSGAISKYKTKSIVSNSHKACIGNKQVCIDVVSFHSPDFGSLVGVSINSHELLQIQVVTNVVTKLFISNKYYKIGLLFPFESSKRHYSVDKQSTRLKTFGKTRYRCHSIWTSFSLFVYNCV